MARRRPVWVSPADGAPHAETVAQLAAEVELWLLRQLRDLLEDGIERDTWADEVLTRLMLWKVRVARHIDGAVDQLADAVADALLLAHADGYALALVGDDPVVPGSASRAVASAETLGQRLAGVMQGIPGLLDSILREVVRAGAVEVVGGKVARVAAAQHVLDRLAERGISGFRDAAGRNWSLVSYVEMAVRTESANVMVDAHVQGLTDQGIHLARVSDSPKECPLCRPWEGQILALTAGVTTVLTGSVVDGRSVLVEAAGTLDEARAAGLFHPNCTHRLVAYLPGTGPGPGVTEDPAGYQAKQRQRYMERKIREWKRREALALDDGAAAHARGKVREWQAALRDHVDANDLKRLRRREQIDFAR